jgi:hypothetical protein
MPIPGNRLTTAMAVMPHRDVDRALELSLSLDVPYWPQLPKVSYFEDMYVQASEHFPGMGLDLDILSLDVYSNGEVFSSYAPACENFLDRGGILSWGIVPTHFEPFVQETLDSVGKTLNGVWHKLNKKGIDLAFLQSRSLLSPAHLLFGQSGCGKDRGKSLPNGKGLSARLREKFKRS